MTCQGLQLYINTTKGRQQTNRKAALPTMEDKNTGGQVWIRQVYRERQCVKKKKERKKETDSDREK